LAQPAVGALSGLKELYLPSNLIGSTASSRSAAR